MRVLAALCAATAAPALAAAAVKSTLLMLYDTGAAGSGAMPCSVSLSHPPTGPPAAAVAQYLNSPIGVQAFSSAAGADSPTWSFWPESTDMDLSWQLAGSRVAAARGGGGGGGVDTVVLQYSNEQFTSEDANCTLWGVSTAASAAPAFKPLWRASVAHCDVVGPQLADYNNMPSTAITADGATLVASLVVGGVQTLMGWEVASGRQLYATPTPGGSYGVALSGNGQWALVASDDGNGGRSAFVHSTATGKQRGTSGCTLHWNAAPALSDDGAVIAAGSQNGMTLCAWDAGSSAYGQGVRVDMPSRGE
jgi:hypothetical protein